MQACASGTVRSALQEALIELLTASLQFGYPVCDQAKLVGS